MSVLGREGQGNAKAVRGGLRRLGGAAVRGGYLGGDGESKARPGRAGRTPAAR